MGIFSFVKAGGKKFGSIVGTGPKVNKTKLDKAKTDLAIGKQKLQGSTAKLKQTQFEIKNKLPLTFNRNNKKTLSNTEKAKLRNDESKKAFKASEGKTKVFYPPKNFNKGGRVGKKFGGGADMGSKKLSPKQMKIASLAGNKKKIDAPDFKKLRAMKSPMQKQVRKT